MQISQEPEEKRVQIQGLQVNCRIKGEGEPLLILHGWGGSSDSWILVQKKIAKEGFNVICPDFPGFGKSKTPKEPWNVDDYVEWLRNFIEKVKIKEPFYLLGHSFGGGIALKLAVRYPQKVSFLVLVAPAILRQRKLRQYIYFPFSKIGKFVFSLPILVFFQPLMRKIFYRFLGVSDYYKLEAGVMKEAFKDIIREDLQEFLPKISCRTLIIWGKQDKVTPLQDAYIIKEKIQDSELRIIEGANHLPHFEKPEKLTEIIIKFLKS